MTSSMNFSLPASLKSFVEMRVKSGGYRSHDEYLGDLVRKDEEAMAQAALKDRLEMGLASPIGRPWKETEALLRARIAQSAR